MKLEKKILCTYILFILAFVLWGCLSIYSARELFSQTSSLYNRPLAVTQNAHLAQKGIFEANTLLFQILLKKENDFFVEQSELKKLDALVHHSMKIVKSRIRFEAGKRLASQAVREIHAWKKYRDALIRQRQEGRTFTGEIFEQIIENKNYQTLFRTMSRIITYASDRSDEFYFDSLDTVRKIFVLNVSISILLILICVITAYEVYRAMKNTRNNKEPF